MNFSENLVLNNEVQLTGYVDSDLTFSHEVYGEGFYSFVIKVPRLSDISDLINATISERLIDNTSLSRGDIVTIKGQFRSYNNYSGTGNKLMLTVFVRDFSHITEDEINGKDSNYIYLNGYICKPPVYRVTPFGREITDILIAVNRAYNKSDYIPCIAWGRNARFGGSLETGENVRLWGRIQSREYQKKISDDETVTKTAYEISVSKMEVVKEECEFEII